MTKMQLGVIFGGRSVEHEVSVVSAIEMIKAADSDRFDVVPFGVTRDGRWLTPEETHLQLGRDDPPFQKRLEGEVPRLLERHEIFDQLSSVDVLFPLVHGINGEDGTLQGMLEMFALPYAGCGVAASAIGMDKGLQKHLLVEAGIDVAPYIELRESHWTGDARSAALQIEQAVGYPAFIKPSNGGSSVGVSKAHSREDLEGAMKAAFAIDGKVLVETAIRGREIECGVIGGQPASASPVGEVMPAGEFYDYAAKYLEDSARLVAPAELDDETVESVQETAVEVFDVIQGGAGFARVDFFLERDGHLVFNEINTIPGFTPISMFPRLWQLTGLTYRELISKLVDLALGRFREREARNA
ncbi:MAG: D-alanine--D-alanine ligase family protein [Dehalococcoidia bacterium]